VTALRYQTGLGNTFQTEARPGALPETKNSPHPGSHGLYAEQINGTGFTADRALNQRTWTYRLRPQILDRPFTPLTHARFTGQFASGRCDPQVRRFRPVAVPEAPTDFLDGLVTFAGTGDPTTKRGMAVHLYAANKDMARAFCDVDSDLLIMPERGRLHVITELGRLEVGPAELLVVPRGIRFMVQLLDGTARGFAAEVFDGHLRLPNRGPIGANGMADERHFRMPVAWFEDRKEEVPIVVKQGGELYQTTSPFSPFDVVAWHGNYAPYCYALDQFASLGSVSWDHPDPSILTVLTCPADDHGTSALDLAVFRRRWDVSQDTFRPPFFHRNSAVEFNAVVASPATRGPWQPGAFSFTPYLSPHGISARHAEQERARGNDSPHLVSGDQTWIQLESSYMLRVMPWMLDHPAEDDDYLASFSDYAAAQLADDDDSTNST
jgi:homogentisate 1,2-dioxygenase